MQRIFQHFKAPLHNKTRYFFARAEEFRPKVCFYKVLNVSSDAKFEEIKSSYLKLAKKYHPDANPDLIQSEKFKDISEAYNILSNKEKREQYDSRNGMRSKWKYEDQDTEKTYGFEQEESPKEDPIEKQKTDEQAFEYFDKKYFKNTDYFKKNVIDDNEFELTMKLYKTHKEEVTEKKKDYVEFFPETSSHYYVHKKVEAQAVQENNAGNLLYEFRVPILVLALGIIGLGINQGVSSKDNQILKVSQSNENKRNRTTTTASIA